jgi:hypothetical protein
MRRRHPITGIVPWEMNELLLDLSLMFYFEEKHALLVRRRDFFSLLSFFLPFFLSLFLFSNSAWLVCIFSGSPALYTLTLPEYYITRANGANGREWKLQ